MCCLSRSRRAIAGASARINSAEGWAVALMEPRPWPSAPSLPEIDAALHAPSAALNIGDNTSRIHDGRHLRRAKRITLRILLRLYARLSVTDHQHRHWVK